VILRLKEDYDIDPIVKEISCYPDNIQQLWDTQQQTDVSKGALT